MTGLKRKSKGMFAQLQSLYNSRIPAIWLLSTEEQRVERGIAKLAVNITVGEHKGLCGIWSLTGGENHAGGWDIPRGWQAAPYNGEDLPQEFSPGDDLGQRMVQTVNGGIQVAINWALVHPAIPAILIIRDSHNFLLNDYFRRVVKDASTLLRGTWTTLVCVGASDDIPVDLKRDLAILRPELPTLQVLEAHVSSTLKSLEEALEKPDEALEKPDEAHVSSTLKRLDANARECAAALRGLGCSQAVDLVTLDFAENGDVAHERLSRMKAEALASVHGVSFKGEAGDFGSVGGFEPFKTWMRRRRHAFGQHARDAGIDKPKGVVFVGVPGGGKTLMGAAAAGELGLPFIVFNPSECEGGIVGETATRTAEALRTIDALAPCVVLVDEIEKVFGGQGNLDGGSKSGMLRLLLIWLQERESESFTMITSNDISGLPPELTRRGRVDEIWFCDLPSRSDREQILSIHLNKRRRELPAETIKKVAATLDGYTGSEIEQVVKEAHLAAYCRFCEGEEGVLTKADLIEAAAPITPMAVTYAGKLSALRQWAKGRARYASEPEAVSPPPEKRVENDPGPAPAPGTPLFRNDALAELW